MRRSVLLVAVVLVGVPRPARAQLVQGRVVLVGSGKPLEGVSVRLVRVTPADTAPLPADTTPLATYRTGRDGVFSLVAPDTGVYRARIGDGFVGPVTHLASADTLAAHEYQMRPGEARALFDYEVEVQAGLAGGLATRYPSDLQRRGITGRVLVQFVVGVDGRAEMGTFRVVESTHDQFSQTARAAVATATFVPARVRKQPVRQLVQLPITFSLGAGASRATQNLPYGWRDKPAEMWPPPMVPATGRP